jgi:hypothetical protein
MHLFQMYKDQMGNRFDQRLIDECQFVDISSVARWFYEENERSQYDLEADLPSMVSPWPMAWLEYKEPPTLRIGSVVHDNPVAGRLAGAALQCHPIDDGEEALRDDIMLNLFLRHFGDQKGPGLDREVRRRRIDKLIAAERFPKWLQQMIVFHEGGNKTVKTFCVQFQYLDEMGRICGDSTMEMALPGFIGVENTFLTTFAFALSLMHCKNVTFEIVVVPPKVQKAREKRGVANITFKTLVIEPLRQQVRREAAAGPTGEQSQIKRAMHIARGHFKDYRNGPGLFGKLQGLYWWDMHVRGSADAGVVVKDYQVKR